VTATWCPRSNSQGAKVFVSTGSHGSRCQARVEGPRRHGSLSRRGRPPRRSRHFTAGASGPRPCAPWCPRRCHRTA
jgi:hypothetical protein